MEADRNCKLQVYHINRHIAKHAASCIKQEIVELWNEPNFNLKKFILQLAKFHMKYAQASNSEALLIDALIDDCNLLVEDWEVWTDILLKQKVRPLKAFVLSKMMIACIWITATGNIPVSRAKTLQPNFKIETSPLCQKAMTEHFVEHFPQLISKYGKYRKILTVLAIIPCSFYMEMRRTLDMTNVVKTLLHLFVTSHNKILDLTLCNSIRLLLSKMENPPEWHVKMSSYKQVTAHNMFVYFQKYFEEWYIHDNVVRPYENKWRFVFYLSKVIGFSTIIDLLHGHIIYYSIIGLHKLFHDELFNDPDYYEIANRFVVLFYYGTSELIIHIQKYADREETLEWFVSKFWSSIKTGFQLMSKMLLNEHPLSVRRFNYILYTEILCGWSKLITSIPYLKICQYKIKHETVLNINYILRKTVDIMDIPEERDIEMCVKVLTQYCELLQHGIIDCYNVAHICEYFRFYKQKHLFSDILKQTVYHLLQHRQNGIIVADVLLNFISQIYLQTKEDEELRVYVMIVSKGIERMLPRNSTRIAKPLFHFVKTGIDFAAKNSIGFLRLLSMFALRLTRRKALEMEKYFTKTLQKHVRHPDYKYFALRIGEYTRRLTNPTNKHTRS